MQIQTKADSNSEPRKPEVKVLQLSKAIPDMDPSLLIER